MMERSRMISSDVLFESLLQSLYKYLQFYIQASFSIVTSEFLRYKHRTFNNVKRIATRNYMMYYL